MNIILLGAQGSGKGTQAQMLKDKFGFVHISPGELIRKGVAEKDSDALKLKTEYVDKGLLVPAGLIARIVQKNLGEKNIFDGFPRTLEQAESLDSMAQIDAVIELKIPDDVSVKRLSGRRQCRKCGFVYGLENPSKSDKCDKCGGEIYQRDDDKPEPIRKRLELYHEETEPLLEYYKPRNIVHLVDGTKSIGEIFKALCKILETLV